MGCRSRWVHQFGVDQWKPWDIVVCKKKHMKPFIKLTNVKWHQIFSWLVFVRRHGQCRPPEKCDNWTKSLKRKICLLIYNTVGCKKIWVVFSGFPIALRHWQRGPPKNALIGISTIFGQILGLSDIGRWDRVTYHPGNLDFRPWDDTNFSFWAFLNVCHLLKWQK